jgi:hypothetical protein
LCCTVGFPSSFNTAAEGGNVGKQLLGELEGVLSGGDWVGV